MINTAALGLYAAVDDGGKENALQKDAVACG